MPIGTFTSEQLHFSPVTFKVFLTHSQVLQVRLTQLEFELNGVRYLNFVDCLIVVYSYDVAAAAVHVIVHNLSYYNVLN